MTRKKKPKKDTNRVVGLDPDLNKNIMYNQNGLWSYSDGGITKHVNAENLNINSQINNINTSAFLINPSQGGYINNSGNIYYYGDNRKEIIFVNAVQLNSDGTPLFLDKQPSEPPEQYWSGGTNPDTGGDSVDVFLNGDLIDVGVSNGNSNALLNISRDDAIKLIMLLREAVNKADKWTHYIENSQPQFQPEPETDLDNTDDIEDIY